MLKNVSKYIMKTLEEAREMTTDDLADGSHSGKELLSIESGLDTLIVFLSGVKATKENLNEIKLQTDLKKLQELQEFINTSEIFRSRIVSYLAR